MTSDAYIWNLVIGAVLLGLIPAAIAKSKGLSFGFWWVFGAALFIAALPLSLMAKPSRAGQKQCSSCTEWINGAATACPRCGRDQPALTPAGWYPVEGGYERYWDGLQWTNRGRRD